MADRRTLKGQGKNPATQPEDIMARRTKATVQTPRTRQPAAKVTRRKAPENWVHARDNAPSNGARNFWNRKIREFLTGK